MVAARLPLSYPPKAKSFQSAALEILKQGFIVHNMQQELYSKLDVTLSKYEEEIREPCPIIQLGWYNDHFLSIFNQLQLYTRMCWLKTIAGGWCTGIRFSSLPD